MPKPFREAGDGNARRRKARGKQQSADWTSIPADLLQQAIATITGAQGAIRFGYTRDGGAYAVGILGDGEPYTEYLRPSDDVVAYFEGLIQDWEGPIPPLKAS
jgi:hypothetical protein